MDVLDDLEQLIANWKYLAHHERKYCGRTYSHTANRLDKVAKEIQKIVDKYRGVVPPKQTP